MFILPKGSRNFFCPNRIWCECSITLCLSGDTLEKYITLLTRLEVSVIKTIFVSAVLLFFMCCKKFRTYCEFTNAANVYYVTKKFCLICLIACCTLHVSLKVDYSFTVHPLPRLDRAGLDFLAYPLQNGPVNLRPLVPILVVGP